MPMDGIPIPGPITVIRLPLYVPVKASIPRTLFTCTGFSKKRSAISLARSGSPAMIIVLAISSYFAPICGVGVFSFAIICRFLLFVLVERPFVALTDRSFVSLTDRPFVALTDGFIRVSVSSRRLRSLSASGLSSVSASGLLSRYHEIVVLLSLLEQQILAVEQCLIGDRCLRVGQFLFVH